MRREDHPSSEVWLADLNPSRGRGIPSHVEVRPPDGGLREVSFAMCEQLRAVAADRLGSDPFGSVSAAVLDAVEDRLRLLLDLWPGSRVDRGGGRV